MSHYKINELQGADGYRYETVENDENAVRMYTLQNGLTVYLAKNLDAPRIQTYIAVRAGSNDDPAENTGLAHYLEHMMFKGSSRLGSADWQRESVLLDEVSELFEQHRHETDSAKKAEIYRRIDEISLQAAEFAIPNEYDKAISSLGASGTNAHTWLNETVYKNNIPANELEKWLRIEQERFSGIALRLFHTELESVYEEFNRAQDNDARLVHNTLMELLFPNHPNGQQTTLGRAEHLKNPSMKAIRKYFDSYYVPNNLAMVLVGDLDFEETIALVDRYFGKFSKKPLPERPKIIEEPITQIRTRTVKSPSIPRMQLAWRLTGSNGREALLAEICANILHNHGEAGLVDLNINQEQKVLGSAVYAAPLKEYGFFCIDNVPKENQTFKEATALFLEQIERIKSGKFPDWLIPAIVSDFKLQRISGIETADGLATNLYECYIKGRSWQEELQEMDEFASVTKAEIMAFAREFFKENYVAVYKEQGVNENLIRVENPGITPVKINREGTSEFLKEILDMPSPELQPQFIDYHKEIKTSETGGRKLSFVRNIHSGIAQAFYIFPVGTDHLRELSIAASVLQYLGTSRFTPAEIRQEMYKNGFTVDFKTMPGQLQISVTALEENLPKGIALMNHWLQDAKPDQQVYEDFVAGILERRAAAKADKSRIMMALSNYARYGAYSRTTDVIGSDDLAKIDCGELTFLMRELLRYPYEIFFYGKDLAAFSAEAEGLMLPADLPLPSRKAYPEPATTGKRYFVDYDMVQAEMLKVANAGSSEPRQYGTVSVFNEYFGRGLSSVVFQEIRESKSLAYSAYVNFATARELGLSDMVTSYIGTQPDKLAVATASLDALLTDFPKIPIQFESAKMAALKQIASGRVTRTNIFFNYKNLQKIGIDYDIRRDTYEEIINLNLPKLAEFFDRRIKPLSFNLAILGSRKTLDFDYLEKFGKIEELSKEEIFGF